MKSKMLWIIVLAFCLSGCGAVRFGTYIDSKIMPNYQVSAERIKTMAPMFKTYWGYISGFIQGNPYFRLKAPVIVQESMKELDSIHIKAKADTWNENEQGEMATLILLLEYEGGKYIRDEYGDTVINLIKQIAVI